MSALVYKAIYDQILLSESKKPNSLCCVCLQAIGEDMSWIQDEVQFKLSTTVDVKTLACILEALIGKSFYDVSSMFQVICSRCKEVAICSYSFILSSRDNMQVLNTAIEDLEKCFTDNMPQSIIKDCKSLFIELNFNKDNTSPNTRSYYDKATNKSLTEGLERMRLIIEDENNLKKIYDKPNVINMEFDLDLEFGPDDSNPETMVQLQIEYEKPENLKQEQILSEVAIELQNTKRIKHFYCPDCKAGFNCPQRYKKHRQAKKKCTSRGRGHYSCDRCGFTAVYKSLLNRHLRFQHDSPTITCEWCGKSCNSQSELRTHLLKHTDERNFKCQECDGRFKTAATLKNHMTVHSGERNYPCNFCDKSFRNASSRNEHTRRHHVQEPAQCDICKKVFKVKEDLLRHIKKHLSDERGKFPCSECAHRAYSKNDLEEHVSFRHRGERPFKCDLCDKSFGTKRTFQSHMTTHKNKTYDCKECDQSFRSLFGFKSHMFKHTGLKPYTCKYCDQTFKDTSRRMDHVKRHHIFESHECDICKKVYRTRPDLQRHKKRHLDEKRKFPCSK